MTSASLDSSAATWCECVGNEQGATPWLSRAFQDRRSEQMAHSYIVAARDGGHNPGPSAEKRAALLPKSDP